MFNEWSKELQILREIQIPRRYFEEQVESLELHMFSDSSQDVYGRLSTRKSCHLDWLHHRINFVFEKARVLPMKPLTNPNLELQALLLATRLRNIIQNALKVRVGNTFMWTDSTPVLPRLHSIEKQSLFVTNRVAEILDLLTVEEWNFVKSNDNPADARTRGLSANSLRDSPWP